MADPYESLPCDVEPPIDRRKNLELRNLIDVANDMAAYLGDHHPANIFHSIWRGTLLKYREAKPPVKKKVRLQGVNDDITERR